MSGKFPNYHSTRAVLWNCAALIPFWWIYSRICNGIKLCFGTPIVLCKIADLALFECYWAHELVFNAFSFSFRGIRLNSCQQICNFNCYLFYKSYFKESHVYVYFRRSSNLFLKNRRYDRNVDEILSSALFKASRVSCIAIFNTVEFSLSLSYSRYHPVFGD